MLTTPLCHELGIRYPIFSVGFGRGARPSSSRRSRTRGAAGVLGTGQLLRDEGLREEIAQVRARTDHAFGVNVILAVLSSPRAAPVVEALIRGCYEEQVPALVLFWGDPAPFVEEARRAGTKLFVQVGSVEEAAAAAEAGVDAIIAQGSEAGVT